MTAVPVHTISWQCLDRLGGDSCRIMHGAAGWHLQGHAELVDTEQGVIALDYQAHCDLYWNSIAGRIQGKIGKRAVLIEVEKRSSAWYVNGVCVPALDGLLDLDFGFTPATNLLAIRRLQLQQGDSHFFHCAWLDTTAEDWQFRVLEQQITCLASDRLHYCSPAHNYEADLLLDDFGCVRHYPGLWRQK
ncbi:putative glycolipid-binding domain-containing protein [uncultured Oxalicibacterium sp.]|uniref:putative glycolipid-binding domain-containing protein n=1 Tax=uncultured Oxalicibacterium sp. TaxID=1168540 RepID=UPI0025E19F71|nr:putative glycolipid-binding domain-containing protein [uncultured Oxalicibacterium sp.]